jgi:hypothetical protein
MRFFGIRLSADGRDERGGNRDQRGGQDEVCDLTFEPMSELIRAEGSQPGTGEAKGERPQPNGCDHVFDTVLGCRRLLAVS